MNAIIISAKEKIYSKEFLKYFIIGSSSVLIDLGTLYLFKEIFNFSPIISVVLNQIIVYSYVFLMNKFFVFSSDKSFLKQLIKYLIIASMNYLVAILWMWFFNKILGQNYLLVRTANIVLSVIWNFFLYKLFIYK